MKVIVVSGIPAPWNMKHVMLTLSRSIGGHFEAMKFGPTSSKNLKIAYFRISDDLDANEVVNNINRSKVKGCHFRAAIPGTSKSKYAKGGKKMTKKKLNRKLGIRPELPPPTVVMVSLQELLSELQVKYTELYNLSLKTQQRLLEEIYKVMVERLKVVADNHLEDLECCFKFTKAYRKYHQHFTDFDLIKKCLQIVDTENKYASITDKDLIKPEMEFKVVGELSHQQVNKIAKSFCIKINKEISQYIDNLDPNEQTGDAAYDENRKRIREQIKKVKPFIDLVVREATSVNVTHNAVKTASFIRMRIYGEPYLPTKEHLQGPLGQHAAVKIQRSDLIYNMIRFNIPAARYASIMALDGANINGATLVVRCSDCPIYKVPVTKRPEIVNYVLGQEQTIEEQPVDSWTEPW